MSVDQTHVIDFVSMDGFGAEVSLTISDHLDWSEALAHVQILQDKVNSYLAAIESGALFDAYPSAIGRKLSIVVRFRVQPPTDGVVEKFLEECDRICKLAGVAFRWR